jgi:hypothetical protein
LNLRWPTLAVLVLCAVPARADEHVEVTVVAIVASARNADVHPKLRDVAREIRAVHPELTGYRLARQTHRSIAVGTRATFPLIDDQEVTVTVRKSCDKDGKVELSIKPPLVGEITYTTCCRKYFPIMTRYQTKDRDRLILAVMVAPCKGKKK